MGVVSGSNEGHDGPDEAEGSRDGEADGLVVGFAFHSPLDVWAILPDWLEEVEIKSIANYVGPQAIVQAVFGHERDLKKLGIMVVDGSVDAIQELTPSKLDVILRQHLKHRSS